MAEARWARKHSDAAEHAADDAAEVHGAGRLRGQHEDEQAEDDKRQERPDLDDKARIGNLRVQYARRQRQADPHHDRRQREE